MTKHTSAALLGAQTQKPGMSGKSLSEQLAQATGRPVPRKFNSRSFKNPLPETSGLIGDGVDHINIGSYAETDLGKILNPDVNIRLNHPLLGPFGNMGAFWVYVQHQERDDRCRYMTGTVLKNFASKMTKVVVPNFRAIILDGHWYKISANAGIAQAMIESELPFDYYFIHNVSNLRIRYQNAAWIIDGMNEIRAALKENRKPDFSKFMDRTHAGKSIEKAICDEFKISAPAEPEPEEIEAEAEIGDEQGKEQPADQIEANVETETEAV